MVNIVKFIGFSHLGDKLLSIPRKNHLDYVHEDGKTHPKLKMAPFHGL